VDGAFLTLTSFTVTVLSKMSNLKSSIALFYWFLIAVVLVLLERMMQVQRVMTLTGSQGVGRRSNLSWYPPIVKKVSQRHHENDDGMATIPSILSPYANIIQRSDTIQLQHCLPQHHQQLSLSLWNNFTDWAFPILQHKFEGNTKFDAITNQTKQLIHDEFIMQLFEIYLSTFTNLCNFSLYQFHRIPHNDNNNRNNNNSNNVDNHKKKSFQNAHSKLLSIRNNNPKQVIHSQEVRIVFIIVAFQDADHLHRLIRSIIGMTQHHLVIIHIEQQSSLEFQNAVNNIAEKYTNVVVLRFGTIVYETDSVSQVNLEIFEWLHHSMNWEYDYAVTLGGAVYPLWNATALNRHLYQAKLQGQQVWLGELLHNSHNIHHPQAMMVWNRKRLYTTTTVTGEKFELRLGNVVGTTIPLPQWLDHAMHHKSTSGNQGVYSYTLVEELLQSPRIKQLFALAKYGCCCCLEERTWIAAMDILGFLNQAKENYSMFQLWGGPATTWTGAGLDMTPITSRRTTRRDTSGCRGGMKNSVLGIDDYPYPCYRSEHAYDLVNETDGRSTDKTTFMINGSQIWDRLVLAKIKGTLFARKFHSDSEPSMQLLQRIVQEMHGS
jgi:hypothetical protein